MARLFEVASTGVLRPDSSLSLASTLSSRSFTISRSFLGNAMHSVATDQTMRSQLPRQRGCIARSRPGLWPGRPTGYGMMVSIARDRRDSVFSVGRPPSHRRVPRESSSRMGTVFPALASSRGRMRDHSIRHTAGRWATKLLTERSRHKSSVRMKHSGLRPGAPSMPAPSRRLSAHNP